MLDNIVVGLFILFFVVIFSGYHRQKREQDERDMEDKKK